MVEISFTLLCVESRSAPIRRHPCLSGARFPAYAVAMVSVGRFSTDLLLLAEGFALVVSIAWSSGERLDSRQRRTRRV
jgi:hypothetical protein